MTPVQAHKSYLSLASQSYARLDEIADIQRRNVGDITPELAAERAAIQKQLNDSMKSLWEAFKEWSEKECGYKPITMEQVRRYLDEHR